jgi:hypothetical protein
MSAREDARQWAGLTGLRHLADTEVEEDEEWKVEDDGRRDTAVAMDLGSPRRVFVPAGTRDGGRGRRRSSF